MQKNIALAAFDKTTAIPVPAGESYTFPIGGVGGVPKAPVGNIVYEAASGSGKEMFIAFSN